MRILVAIALILLINPAIAIQVPTACVELAKREGFPTDYMSDSQYRRAKRRLIWLSINHPKDELVKNCVAAVN